MTGFIWNIFFMTLVGAIIWVIRRIWGSKIFPQVLTAFWTLFFVSALLPFSLLGQLGSYIISVQPAPERLKGWDYEPMGHLALYDELQADTTSLLTEFRAEQTILWGCVLIWLIGMLVSLVIKYTTHKQLVKRLKEHRKWEWQAWEGVNIFPKKRITVYITQDMGPMVYGIPPTIYVPEAFVEQEALKSILLHELTHVSRKHHYILLLTQIIDSVYWFLPYVKWIFVKCLREDMEHRCDYEVLKQSELSNKEYARHYVAVNAYQAGLSAPLSFGEGKFKKRLELILKPPKDKLRTALAVVVLVLTTIGTGTWLATNYLQKDTNGFTKWDVQQARQVVLKYITARNSGNDELSRSYLSANKDGLCDVTGEGVWELYNLEYEPENLSYYYAHKYMERHGLDINDCIYLQGKFSYEEEEWQLQDVIWGFYLVREDDSGQWKLYDWGQ